MKPSLPKGTRDFAPSTVHKRQLILSTIREVMELFGYQPIETPAFENLSTLTGKYGEEGDRLIFKILNNGLDATKHLERTREAFEEVLKGKSDAAITERALRYDLTIPFARFVVMHQHQLAFPFKRYQMQPVWRADRPQRGRYREFWQCDADVVGSKSLFNEAELLAVYRESFHRLNVPQVVLRINNRKILAGLAAICGATDSFMAITIAIDKLEKIAWEGVSQELRKSGLDEKQLDLIKGYLSISGDNESMLSQMEEYLAESDEALQGIKELREVLSMHQSLSSPTWESSVAIDFTLARGLNYYTGFIVEGITNAVPMGSIAGGGRYDNLTGLFGLPGVSGVGISFGVDRIYDIMEELGLFPEEIQKNTQVLFLNMGSSTERSIFQHISHLRSKEIITEYYPDKAKLDRQMKYADKRNIRFVAILGENELQKNSIVVKDMHTGKQESIEPNMLLEAVTRAEHS